MQGAGTLAEHFSELFDDSLADSSWADRRARLPWEIFAELMRRVLRPQGDAAAARGVLARLAAGRARWHAIQPDQHAADHRDDHESADAPRPRGLRQDHDHGALELGVHNPLAAAIGRARRVRMGAGPAACWHSCRNGRWCWPIGCMGAPRLRRTRAPRASGSAVTSCCAPAAIDQAAA